MQSYRNIMPGFGSPADGPPPPDLDWNMFLGPAPERPYNPNRGLYHFRWFWDYSGGQMTNLGQHSLDIVDWFLGPLALKSVASFGGRFALRTTAKRLTRRTPSSTLLALTRPASPPSGPIAKRPRAIADATGSSFTFHGTKGSLSICRAAALPSRPTASSDRKTPCRSSPMAANPSAVSPAS